MALRVAADDAAWSAVEVYAAWSINVDLFDAEERNIATLHDCGYSVTAELTDAEANGLRARLVGTPVTLLSVIHEQRRVEKREARRRRWGGWLPAGRRR